MDKMNWRIAVRAAMLAACKHNEIVIDWEE